MIEEDQDNNHESEWANIEKSPLMVYTFLLFWGLSLVLYGPKLWQILTTSRTVIEAIILSGISIFYIIFWLLGAYFFATIVFYFFSRPPQIPAFPVGEKKPHVAILYTTCNDFSKEAAVSCLNQNYPYFHIFLLDDSNKDEILSEIDTFHAAHPEITTIVRRATRQGFKPGALNNALLGEAAEYPFFAVIDADEKLPPDFLWQTMAYMGDPKLSFVQANHAPTIQQNATFAQDIGPTILPFWDVHCKVRTGTVL
jgi:cellulose synthase/poly-beta-1,6-N-acetylglucosamine synthase-like glycosyltransferase